MHALALDVSLLTFLDDLEYTEAALSADEETAALAAPFAAEIKAWDKRFAEERASRRSVTRAEAIVAVRNSQLDGETTRFGAAVVAEAGGDRKAALVGRFFPVATSILVRSPLRKQCEHTLDTMVVELEKLDKKSALRRFTGRLTSLAKSAVAALDARTAAKADRGIKAHDVDEYKEGINARRLSTYAELLKLAAEKHHPKTWADAFFRATAAAPGVAEPPAPPAPPS